MGKLAWIIPVAITGTLVLAGVGLYLTFMDLGTSKYQPDENLTAEKLLNRQLVRAFDNVEETKQINYVFDEDCLNQVLYQATKNIQEDPRVGSYVKGFYVEIKDEHYTFYVEADIRFIKTRLILDSTLEDTGDAYIFHLNAIKVGHMPFTGIINATGVLKNVSLESAFSDAGLTVTVDHDNHQIVYKKADMRNDLSKKMSGGANGDDLITGALDAMDFEFGFDKGLYGRANLEPLVKNDSISDGALDGAHYVGYKDKRAAIDLIVENLQYQYANGKSEDEVKKSADDQFATLRGYGNADNAISDKIKGRISGGHTPAEFIVSTGEPIEVASISEAEIDMILESTSIVGKQFHFHYQDEIAYSVVDSFYSDIYTENGTSFMNFTVGINLNGLETRAIVQTHVVPAENKFAADLIIDNIYYGTKIAPESFTKVVKEFLDEGVGDNKDALKDDTFKYDKSLNKFTINFEPMITESLADYQTAFELKDIPGVPDGEKSIKISDNRLGENGKLSLKYKRAIALP